MIVVYPNVLLSSEVLPLMSAHQGPAAVGTELVLGDWRFPPRHFYLGSVCTEGGGGICRSFWVFPSRGLGEVHQRTHWGLRFIPGRF